MSLEAQLAELNLNLQALTAAILGRAPKQGAVDPVADHLAVVEKKTTTKKPAAPAPDAGKPATETTGDSDASGAVNEDKPVEYSQVSAAVLRLMAKIGRDETAKWLPENLGVATAKALAPDQYADALAKLNAALA